MLLQWKDTLREAQQSLAGWQQEGFDPEQLVEQLHEAAEEIAEQEFQGHSDGLILLADLINFQEADLNEQSVEASNTVLNWYLLEQSGVSFPISALQAGCWDEPLAKDEAEPLLELLEAEVPAMLAALVDNAEPIESDDESAADNEISNPQPPLLSDIASQFKQHEITDTEWLEEPVELLSEAGFEGISDLLAMYCGHVADASEDDDVAEQSTICGVLAESIQHFLHAPNEATLELVLNSLASEYDAEELDFLEPLLLDDISKLSAQPAKTTTGAVDVPETAEIPEIVDTVVVDAPEEPADVEDVLPSVSIDIDKPSFVDVNLDLLAESQAAVDLNVVSMLSQSLQEQAAKWHAITQWPDESVLTSTTSQLSATARALETVGLCGARFIVEGLHKNIDWVATADEHLQHAEVASVTQCLDALVSHLASLDDKSHRESLIDACNALVCGPDIQQSAFLSGLLALAGVKDPGSIERKVANQDDVSLNREKDVDDDLLTMLKNELPQLSDEFSLHLQNIVADQQVEALLEAQRSAHTIKGLANMAGIRGVANLTHYMEDILELMTESQLLPSEKVGDDMLDAADCLADMCEQVTAENSQVPDTAIPALQKIFDWHYEAQTQGVNVLAEAIEIDSAEVADAPVVETEIVDNAVADSDVSVVADAPDVKSAPEPEKELPTPEAEEQNTQLSVPVNLLNSLFRLAGESTTLNTQLEEELSSLRRMARSSRERYRSLERVMSDLEQHLHSLNIQKVVSDDPDGEFDELEMDRYNELDSTLSRLQESAADVNEVTSTMSQHVQQLHELQSQQTGLQKETLDTIIRTRMVPVSTISGRFQRIVRQAARATGKKVKLNLVGEQVLIDSQILNLIIAPLMHMIRNSVDHGIESPHARFEVSKPESGEITLTFTRDNDRLLILCEDDGAGIDGEFVRQKAISKGLIEADVELTESEAQRLILLPGFSTKEETSQLSGRGIGMDVVNLEIAKLHGTLQIQSTVGKGTTMELSLPPSALTVRSLLIRCGQQVLALSTQGIDQSIISIDGQYNDDHTLFTFEDEEYEVRSIESLMGKAVPNYSEMSVHPILLVKTGLEDQVALQINEILAHRELIFKEMGDAIPMIPGISGLTILANGEVAPVVDVPSRIRYANSGSYIHTEIVETAEDLGLPKIMVVDDSISARQAIVNLLEDLGYEVDSAIDGFDATNKIRDKKPDLVLTDYEMPRVNGVELASTLKSAEETSKIPIAMITSRSTAKHRQAAEEAGVDRYITKPWTETQLLQTLEELLEEKAQH